MNDERLERMEQDIIEIKEQGKTNYALILTTCFAVSLIYALSAITFFFKVLGKW